MVIFLELTTALISQHSAQIRRVGLDVEISNFKGTVHYLSEGALGDFKGGT